MSTRARVGLVIANDSLRELVGLDLARSGFDVVTSVASPPDPAALNHVDVVVTESSVASGRLFTVRLTEAMALPTGDSAIALAPDDLASLPDLLRTELRRRQEAPV